MENNSVPTQSQYPLGPDGKILKGHSLNPAGPKPGYKHMTTLLHEALIAISKDGGAPADREIIKALVARAKRGDQKAIDLIFDRIDGKVRQNIGLDGGEDGVPIPILGLIKHVSSNDSDNKDRQPNQTD